jgi:DNA-binding IclR family transcriptional regulator
LACFSSEYPTLTAGEIAEMIDLPCATVEDLVEILVMLDCLAQDESGVYRLAGHLPKSWILATAGSL